MTGTVWIPEAEDLTAVGTSGTMLGGPPRAVWHTTEAPSGFSSAGASYFDLMHRVLTGKLAEPHILYDPLTDRMGQYFALDRSSRSLRNDDVSGTSTNKTGTACIQIEVVGYASRPFTDYWKPGPNFAALMRAIRSWGIPDEWPAGAMSHSGEGVSRSLTTWKTRAGHYGHCHVPGNTHWDCGGIDQEALFRVVANPVQEDDMIPQDLLAARMTAADGSRPTVETMWALTNSWAYKAYAAANAAQTQITGLSAAVAALAQTVAAGRDDLTADELREAVAGAIQDAGAALRAAEDATPPA